MGLKLVKTCDYVVCRNPFSHKTIRCVTMTKVCYRCRKRGHSRSEVCKEIKESTLRKYFEEVKMQNKVVSNRIFEFDFPSCQKLFKTLGPPRDEGVATSRVHGWDEPHEIDPCLLYTSPSPRDKRQSRMPSSA